ncbi:MAG: hypothetical protein U5L02_03705 [Rheinheimera sp.]|nr:hypothetical protein [Rheinheimera sp.]
MLHQTLTVVFAVALQPLQLHDGVEAMLLISLTVLGCGLGYEIIRRVPLLNWLAGGAPATGLQRRSNVSQPASTTAS